MVLDRERRLNVRMTDEEVKMLQDLAERDGVSASDYVRVFVRRAYAETFGATTKRAKKPKK